VSNLPQLQAAGHVDAEGRLVKPVVVRRLCALPAPRLGAPKPLVRLQPRSVHESVTVGRIDVSVAVEDGRYERDAATGVRGEWAAVGVGGTAVVLFCVTACVCGGVGVGVCGRVGMAAQCGSGLRSHVG
jgi:hypothetical protein